VGKASAKDFSGIGENMKAHSHTHGSPGLPELTERLRQRMRKVTGPRQAILEILRANPGPMSIKQIHQALPAGDCDLATVYRSMHMLEEMGMVKKFDLGEGGARFELLAEGDDGHHHHLVCTRCSDVVEIEQCFPDQLEKEIASRNGFKQVTHKLEFFGICPRCQ
jgi:Fur family transcriptional regulator, ferric uptake regulator